MAPGNGTMGTGDHNMGVGGEGVRVCEQMGERVVGGECARGWWVGGVLPSGSL